MPRAPSPSSRAGRRLCCTRCDLVTLALAAMLCSATYCFSIWHNGRNAPEKIVLGKTPVVASPSLCGGGGDAYADADAAELDFETHHTAERAGLSVSTKAPSISGRRALRGPARRTMDTVGDDSIRLVHAGAVRD